MLLCFYCAVSIGISLERMKDVAFDIEQKKTSLGVLSGLLSLAEFLKHLFSCDYCF